MKCSFRRIFTHNPLYGCGLAGKLKLWGLLSCGYVCPKTLLHTLPLPTSEPLIHPHTASAWERAGQGCVSKEGVLMEDKASGAQQRSQEMLSGWTEHTLMPHPMFRAPARVTWQWSHTGHMYMQYDGEGKEDACPMEALHMHMPVQEAKATRRTGTTGGND